MGAARQPAVRSISRHKLRPIGGRPADSEPNGQTESVTCLRARLAFQAGRAELSDGQPATNFGAPLIT